MSQEVIQKILLEKYEAKRRVNPSFSQKAFAQKLGLSSGAFSSIANGKRKISKDMAIKLISRLELDEEEARQFFSVFSSRSLPKKQNVDLEYVQLSLEANKIISQWQHFAILSLIKLDDFNPTNEWMAKRLNISEALVKKSVERLVHLKLLYWEKGTLKRSHQKLATSDQIVNMALRTAHRNNLILAERALDSTPIELRDFSAITMVIDIAKIEQAKIEIKQFEDRMSDLLESGAKQEVYKLCIQLYPLTNSGVAQ